MTNILSKEIDQILAVGVPLEAIGIQNWGLTKDQSLEALEKFSILNIAILGGDVLEKNNGQIQHNYDNWYCERLLEETENEFMTRSIEVAKNYIRNYKPQKNDKIFFVIVPKLAEDNNV